MQLKSDGAKWRFCRWRFFDMRSGSDLVQNLQHNTNQPFKGRTNAWAALHRNIGVHTLKCGGPSPPQLGNCHLALSDQVSSDPMLAEVYPPQDRRNLDDEKNSKDQTTRPSITSICCSGRSGGRHFSLLWDRCCTILT